MVSIRPEINTCIGLLHAYLDDIQLSIGCKDLILDKNTIENRTLSEGLGFLTIALPRLGSALDNGLRTGIFKKPSSFKAHRGTALPCLFRGLLRRIFDNNGHLVLEPDVCAIAELRQACYMFYKYVTKFSPKQVLAATKKFRETDASLPQFSIEEKSSLMKSVFRTAKEFLSNLFNGFDPYDIEPCHGPGIVASGERPHEKRIFSTKYKGIHNEYPYYRWFYVNASHLLDCVHDYRARPVKEVGENKVLFVPKDSRGPRTIACEPLEYQFLQGGLRKALYSYIESHPLTKGRINFTDQSINQKWALMGSLANSNIVTLDLKDASDRVSNSLVEYLFSDTRLSRPLQALRTPSSLLPDGSSVVLRKYAAMGSALCFPVEALVFYALIQGVYAFFPLLKPLSFVYGDDLIVQREIVDTLNHVFSDVGLVLNLDKSCTTGFFRESCGAEYYKGWDITYVKVRTLDYSNPDNAASLVALCNSMSDRVYGKTSEYLERLIRKNKALKHIPYGYKDSEYLNLFSTRFRPPLHQERDRWNPAFQLRERRVPVVTGTSYSVGSAFYYANECSDLSEVYAEYYRKITQGWHPYHVPGSYVKRKVKLFMKWTQVGR